MLSVLVVEDHDATRVQLQRMLVKRGFQVACARTVGEGRDVLDGGRFDLLLCDIGLPDGFGYELLRECAENKDMAAVAVSGYGAKADVRRAHEAGFCLHVRKPITAETLDIALQAALGTLEASAPALEARRNAADRDVKPHPGVSDTLNVTPAAQPPAFGG
jgi:CheY-like chemotaxis protein